MAMPDGSNPFRMPTDEEVFALRTEERETRRAAAGLALQRRQRVGERCAVNSYEQCKKAPM